MTTPQISEGAGHARYTYRLRVSSAARTGLMAEWARCRWVWNECVAMSRKVHALNRDTAGKTACGPAQPGKMLTEARTARTWLREGTSVPQPQTIRDFAKSRAKALKDIKAKLPVRQRAGMPRIKRKRDALPTLNYTQRGFRLKGGHLHLAGGIALTVVRSRELPAAPTSVRVYQDSPGHWYASFVVATGTQHLPATGRVLGVDWGVKETATTNIRRTRPPARPARQEGRAAPRPLPADDGPPEARARTGSLQGLPAGADADREAAQEGRPAAAGHRPQVG